MELRKEGEEVVKKFPEPEAAGNTLGDIDEKELER